MGTARELDQEIGLCDFARDPAGATVKLVLDLPKKMITSPTDLGPRDQAWHRFIYAGHAIARNIAVIEAYLKDRAPLISSDQEFIERHALWVAVLLWCPMLGRSVALEFAQLWLFVGVDCPLNKHIFDPDELGRLPLDCIRSQTTDVRASADHIAEHLRSIAQPITR